MACQNCDLCVTRKTIVTGQGILGKLMFVGEAPGYHEDKLGVPFIGEAGQFLTKMLALVGIDRPTECYITNIVKCRPPANRTPEWNEVLTCYPYLVQEIHKVKPKILVLLGNTALRGSLKDSTLYISNERGKWLNESQTIISTYHPSYAMQNLNAEAYGIKVNAEFYIDLKKIKSKFDEYKPYMKKSY